MVSVFPNNFWPKVDFYWPVNYWQQFAETTGGVVAPDFKIYKKIVASPLWSASWR